MGDLGDPMSDQWKVKVRKRGSRNGRGQSDPALETKEWEGHLVHHIDNTLSVVSTEVSDHLNLILARQNCLD